MTSEANIFPDLQTNEWEIIASESAGDGDDPGRDLHVDGHVGTQVGVRPAVELAGP